MWRKSLKIKLPVLIAGPVIVFFFLFISYSINSLKKSLRMETERRAKALCLNLANTMKYHLESYTIAKKAGLPADTSTIKNAMIPFVTGDIMYGIIYDKNLTPIVQINSHLLKSKELPGFSFEETYLKIISLKNNAKVMDVAMPVRTEGLGLIGFVRCGMDLKAYYENIRNRVRNSITMAILFLLLTIITIIIVTKFSVLNPIFTLKKAAEKIERGDIETKVEMNREDELGTLANSINAMVESLKREMEAANNARREVEENARYLQERISEFLKIIEKAAEGDLTVVAPFRNSNDMLDELAKSTNEMFSNLSSLIGEVRSLAEAVASSSEEITQITQQIVEGAKRQEAEAAEAAASTEEMSATILSTAQNASTAQEEAQNSLQNATEGGEKVKEVIVKINSLNETIKLAADRITALGEKAAEIGSIIEMIEEIAEQTNLLALNAQIEAARAGEYGRGFSVVADEIRGLADRSRRATSEISNTLKAIQAEVEEAIRVMKESSIASEEATRIAQEAGEALSRIVEGSRTVTNTITQIATAAEEESAASEEIANKVRAISEIARQGASSAEEVAKAMSDLSQRVITLEKTLLKFKIPEEKAIRPV